MVKSIKSKSKLAIDETKTVIESLYQLIEATALIIVASFAIYQAHNYGHGKFWAYPVLIAGAVIAIRGGLEFVKYLRRK